MTHLPFAAAATFEFFGWLGTVIAAITLLAAALGAACMLVAKALVRLGWLRAAPLAEPEDGEGDETRLGGSPGGASGGGRRRV